MTIRDITMKVRCDMPNCKNMSCVKVEKKGFFKGAGVFLCKDCMEELYRELSLKITPKSPNNMLNKKIKIKKED